MNQTQHLIDNARTWLANPKNATHPNRADIEADLRRLESREHTTASNHAGVGTDADMASQIVSLFAHHAGGAPRHQAAQVRTGAAPDTEAALAAQILSTAGINPRASSASTGHGLTSNATPEREPINRSAADLEAASIRSYLASPESIALGDVNRRQLEQRLAELEGH